MSDLVKERASSLIINFEQVIEPFLVLNIYFIFFLSVGDCTKELIKEFIKELKELKLKKEFISSLIVLFRIVRLRVTVCYYYLMYASEAVVRRCSVKKLFLKISKSSQENAWHRCFPVNFAKFLGTFFLTQHIRWLFLAFQSESTVYSFRTSCSKQTQYLKFK